MMESMGAVLAVLGLLSGLLWLVLRPGLGRGGSGQYLSVLDTASITPGQSLALVRVADRCLLVGTSNGRVEKLAEFPATDLPAPGHIQPTQSGPGRLLSGAVAIGLGRLRPRGTPVAGTAQ